MLESTDDVVVLLTNHMSTTASALTYEGQVAAVDTAMSELNWSFPISDSTKILWIVKRSLRHACFILWVASAQKFKYKQVNLQQRFDHYKELIENMDKEYDSALLSNSAAFLNVETYRMFGTSIGAGFVYDGIGRDLTYSDLVNYINTGE